MANFSFLSNNKIKTYKKTYMEYIKTPRTTFDQPIFGYITILGKVPFKYDICIDNEKYINSPYSFNSHFFANVEVKIQFHEKAKIANVFTMYWYTLEDIVGYLLSLSILMDVNSNSLYSLFIELDNIPEASIYTDTIIPDILLENIEKNKCMKILEENNEDEIAFSQLPFLYDIKIELTNELAKINDRIDRIHELYAAKNNTSSYSQEDVIINEDVQTEDCDIKDEVLKDEVLKDEGLNDGNIKTE